MDYDLVRLCLWGLKGKPETAIVAHQAQRIRCFRDFGQGVAIVVCRFKKAKEVTPRIFGFPQFIDVDISKPGFEHRKARPDRSIDEVFLVGVPADTDARVVSALHHTLHSGGMARFTTVNLDPDFHTEVAGGLPAFAKSRADRGNGSLHGDIFGNSVGANLDAQGADVVGELQELFTVLDIPPDGCLIRGVEFGNRAETEQANRAAGKLLTDSSALIVRQRGFDTVAVCGSQFDRLESGLSAVFDDGRYVPVLGEVVGDEAKTGPRPDYIGQWSITSIPGYR